LTRRAEWRSAASSDSIASNRPAAERKDIQVSNAKTVQDIYAAFGAGDIPAILAKLAADVQWEYGQGKNDVPWLQPRRGREAVVGFFESLGGAEFHKFEPKQIVEGDGVVVAILDVDLTVKATGKRAAEQDEMHLWRFNSAGEVISFRHGTDTHAHQLACAG
jgi:ketosteroid isomerase-like protein